MIEGETTEIRPHCTYKVNNSLDLYQMTRSGFGISYLPDFTVSEGLKSGEIISVLYQFMPPPLPMYMVYINPQPSPNEQVFIDIIRSVNLTIAPEPAK